jgi:hypothetical protein
MHWVGGHKGRVGRELVLRHACDTERSGAARFRHGSEGIGSGRRLNGSRAPFWKGPYFCALGPELGRPRWRDRNSRSTRSSSNFITAAVNGKSTTLAAPARSADALIASVRFEVPAITRQRYRAPLVSPANVWQASKAWAPARPRSRRMSSGRDRSAKRSPVEKLGETKASIPG